MALNVYIPKQDSIRFKVLELARKYGDTLTVEQAFDGLPDAKHDVVRAAMNQNNERGLMNRVGNLYILAGYVVDYFEKVEEPMKEKYVGEPAAARAAIPFRPLKSLPWAIHADKIRDISFHTASGAFQPLGHRA